MENNFLFKLVFISIIFFSSSFILGVPLEQDSFSKIIQNSIPGVVSIKAYKKSNNNDSYFTSSNSTSSIESTSDNPISLGSGFIIKIDSSRIYILTVYHVVHSYNNITVIFYNDKRYYTAKLYKYDSNLDLAVLTLDYGRKEKKDLDNIKSLVLEDNSNMDKLKPGDFILSIGNQNGLVNTSNVGIISFIGRKIKNYTDLIQLDLRMDSGNSGSPIFNIHSNIIGISVGINSSAGFAISTKTIHTFLSKINLNK